MANNTGVLLDMRQKVGILKDALICTQSAAVVGIFYWLPVAVAYAVKRARTFKKQGLLALSIVLVYLVPIKHWKEFQRSKLWDHLLNYFSVTVTGIAPPAVATSSSIMYGVVPHGIVPYSLGLAAFGSLGRFLHYPSMVSASVVKYIPVFAHMLFWGGAIEANATAINTVLSSGADATSEHIPAVAITPGGIAEMFLGYPRHGSHPDEEYALLRDRKGFIKLAINNCTTLVPIFVFGASSIFDRIALPKWIEDFSRYIRASLMVFYGRFRLPIPYKVPLLYALGRHIDLSVHTQNIIASGIRNAVVSAVAANSDEIDFIHNIFINELHRTFEMHKREYGWGHKSLVIV
jgi:hypothetical protein